MKLNPECVRDILLTIESYPEPMNLSLCKFYAMLPQYTENEIYYCCKKLYEANILYFKHLFLCITPFTDRFRTHLQRAYSFLRPVA